MVQFFPILRPNWNYNQFNSIQYLHKTGPDPLLEGCLVGQPTLTYQETDDTLINIYNRVVHSSHFWAIFGSFLASFLDHFRVFGRRMIRMIRKMK